MSDLVADSAEAVKWVVEIKKLHAADGVFGKIVSSVIWSDKTGPDGKLLVAADPEDIVARVKNGMRLLKGHDPGFPHFFGRVIAAASFTSADGRNL